jgi:oligosaccharyl transferase complex subunit OST4
MITDNQLYTLAIFLGSAAMLMIVLYHFLEVNSSDEELPPSSTSSQAQAKSGSISEKNRLAAREERS